uniref:Very long-chain fatty acid transport protein n=1 Tax=Plectus sambesii TaxID=2011161 RepID=A0A914WZ87_9BILA
MRALDVQELLVNNRPILELMVLWATIATVGKPWLYVAVGVWLLYKCVTQRAFLCRTIQTLPRDFNGIKLLVSLRLHILYQYRHNWPLHYYYLEIVKKYPDKVAFIDIKRNQSWTFTEFNQLANQFAHYFTAKGLKQGDVVALYMEQSPEFVAAWMGLSKVGIITAWINYNLKHEPLAHCINTAQSTAIVCSPSLHNAIREAVKNEQLPSTIPIYVYGQADDDTSAGDLSKELHQMSKDEPPKNASVDFKSDLCYIYTSGTTGMPKAAVMKHYRIYWIAFAGGRSFDIRSTDRLYITMPLYHTSAGILGVGQTITKGATSVIREKFSASNFWKDCVKHDCTVGQYIGEICRYLLAQPPVPEEKTHRVRVMVGNGLRPVIWSQFVERFRIQRIGEFYGSTEGTSNIINTNNYVGACGFFPIHPVFALWNPLRLVKVDMETGEIVRNKNGLCIPCQPGETGEMISSIRRRDPLFDFVGYVNKQDTSKKVIRDVFKKGDEAFTSGDILTWDENGYLFFKDRRGDSYRWKGENVSTTEVECILQPLMCVSDATVFGVEIPGMEGRAGMAAIARSDKAPENAKEFLKDVGQRLCSSLPSYAVPIFIRLCKEVDKTGTFKLQKSKVQRQGFSILQCGGDELFYFDTTEKVYQPLTAAMEEDIRSGKYKRF